VFQLVLELSVPAIAAVRPPGRTPPSPLPLHHCQPEGFSSFKLRRRDRSVKRGPVSSCVQVQKALQDATSFVPADFVFQSTVRHRVANASHKARAELLVAAHALFARVSGAWAHQATQYGWDVWVHFLKESRCVQGHHHDGDNDHTVVSEAC
jgi:hypothetical protein